MLRKHVPRPPKLLIVGGQAWGDVALKGLIDKYNWKTAFNCQACTERETVRPNQAARALIYPSLQERSGSPSSKGWREVAR